MRIPFKLADQYGATDTSKIDANPFRTFVWLYFVLSVLFADVNLRDRVALNIQELKRARGLSQEELAHRADVSRGHMGKVENAKFAASLDLLERIAKALNVDPGELFAKR